MKPSVLALDYDGTIATDRGIDRDVRDAIAAARTSGITVLLVTGRILSVSSTRTSLSATRGASTDV